MMSLPRVLVASLVYCLAIGYIGGNAQTSSSDAATTAPSGFLYSVDVVLDDSESPVTLGIRDGQTVAQVYLKGLLLGNGDTLVKWWRGMRALVVVFFHSSSVPRAHSMYDYSTILTCLLLFSCRRLWGFARNKGWMKRCRLRWCRSL